MKPTLRLAAPVAALVLCAACAAAPPAPETLAEKDNGRAIHLAPGASVIVRLEENTSTGYAWEVAALDAAVLKYAGRTTEDAPREPGAPPMAGAPHQLVQTFQAVAAGHTVLKLAYSRPWEHGVAPARSFTLDVTVE